MEEILVAILKSMSEGSIHTTLLWMLFLWVVVLKDIDRRMTGLSAYIKKFLMLQRLQVRATKELTVQISELSKVRRVRKEDVWHADCIPPVVLPEKP